MRTLTKTSEVLAELAAGGRIITGDRPGLLMLVDSGGSTVPAWQTALKSAGKQMTTATPPRTLPPVALAPARAGRTYIAGPMTGLPDFNHATFNAAAAALRAQGRTVINPADHGVVPGAAWEDYVRADLALLAGCEIIYLLPGWSRSRGAMLEHHVARTLGMPVEFADGAETEAEGQKRAEGQMLAEHARLNELLGNSEQLPPAIDLEQFWKLSDSWLAQAERVRALAPDKSTGLWAAAKELRDLLALIDGQAGDNSVRVDRGALQMALNVLRRAGKGEVADALAGGVIEQPTKGEGVAGG